MLTVEEVVADVTVMETTVEKDEPSIQRHDADPVNEVKVIDDPNKPEEVMAMEVDHVVVKQEEEPELIVEEKISAPYYNIP